MPKGILRRTLLQVVLLCAIGVSLSALVLTQTAASMLEDNAAYAGGQAVSSESGVSPQSTNTVTFKGVYAPGSFNSGASIPSIAEPAPITVTVNGDNFTSASQIPSAANGKACESVTYSRYGYTTTLRLVGWTLENIVKIDYSEFRPSDANKGILIASDNWRPGAMWTTQQLLNGERSAYGTFWAVYQADDAYVVAFDATLDQTNLTYNRGDFTGDLFLVGKNSGIASTHPAFTAFASSITIGNPPVDPVTAGYTFEGYKLRGLFDVNTQRTIDTNYTFGSPITRSSVIYASYATPSSMISNLPVRGGTNVTANGSKLGGPNMPYPVRAVVSASSFSSSSSTYASSVQKFQDEMQKTGFTPYMYYAVTMRDDNFSNYVNTDFGTLILKFPVEAAYNGKTFTIWHLHGDKSMESTQVQVVNGFAELEVTKLSEFALGTDNPITPPAANTGGTGSGGTGAGSGTDTETTPPAAENDDSQSTEPPATPQTPDATGKQNNQTSGTSNGAGQGTTGEMIPKTTDVLTVAAFSLGLFIVLAACAIFAIARARKGSVAK